MLKIQELCALEMTNIQASSYIMAIFNRRAMLLKSVTFEEWIILLFVFSPFLTLPLL